MVGIGLCCCSPSPLLAMSARDQILGLVVTPLPPVEDAVVVGGTWWLLGGVLSGDGWRNSRPWEEAR